ncbi:MAG TPA: HD domain-containing protein [Ktedonobacteraceae bacterium]|nr:HD domain-containing protein [Ktedonobacteraceae bacterium]
MKLANIAKYLYEIGHLKHQKRTGWWRMGVREPESVAEHSYRTAVIGYVLATLEGANPERTAVICLFHDTAETRIGDLHWVAKRYLHVKEAEQVAFDEQVKQLPGGVANAISNLVNEYKEKSSQEALLAREADLLECLLQSREYEMQGYTKGLEWAKICREGLQNDTARNLADACLNSDPGDWFQNLQENPRFTNLA